MIVESNQIKSSIKDRIFLIFLPLAILAISHIPFFFIFPLNYGWWQAWVNLWPSDNFSGYLAHGYVFPPLYLEYYKLLPWAQKFPALSMFLGVLRTLALFLIIKHFVARIRGSNDFTAALIGFVACIVVVRPTIYLPDDYHTFVSFFVVLTLGFFYLIINFYEEKKIGNKIYLLIFIESLLSVITFLSKQNIGGLLWVGIFISFLIIFSIKHKLWYAPFTFLIFTFLIFFSFKYTIGFTINDILDITINNSSKGNKITILTNFIISDGNFNAIYISTILVLALVLLRDNITLKISNFFRKLISNNIFFIFFYICVISFISINLLKFVEYLACISSIYFLYMFISTRKLIYLISFPFLALIFANTLTSGLASEDMIFLCIPALIYLCDNFYLTQDKRTYLLTFITLIFITGFLTIHDKFKRPYSWYGIEQSSISYSLYPTPYDELRGISTDLVTFKSLTAVKEAINKYSLADDDVLLYPNIPFFYVLHQKTPPYGIPVYWFDTTLKSNLDKLFLGLKNKRPRLIIFFDPPGFAYRGHADMKKSITDQENFMKIIDQYQNEGVYRLISYTTFDNSIYSSSNSDIFYQINAILLNNDLLNKNNSFLLSKLDSEGVIYKNFNNLSSGNDNILRVNNILNISVRGGDIDTALRIIGKRLKSEDKFYSLKIYLLNN